MKTWVILAPCLVLLLLSSCDRHESGRGGASGQGAAALSHDQAQTGRPELIELSDEALRQVTIRTSPVSRRLVLDAIRLPAEIRSHPDHIAHITPLVPSQVTEVKAKPGDQVEKGQVLALLKSVELGEARAQIAQAKAALEVAKDQLSRQDKLRDAGIGAEKSHVQAQGAVKQAEAALAAAYSRASVYGGSGGTGGTTVLRSPLAGTVVRRHATAGEIATPDQELFVIANVDPVWVIGRAYESDLARVHAGTPAQVRVKAHGERTWEGTVGYVAPTLDERTRTAEVRVELENPDRALKPGMFASIVLIEGAPDAGTKALAVPHGAVQRDGERSMGFVARDDHRFEPRLLKLGKRGAEYVEVLEGLREGESVVVEGTFILRSEAEKHDLGGGHRH